MPNLVWAPEQNGGEAELNNYQCADSERIKEIIKLRIYENWSSEWLLSIMNATTEIHIEEEEKSEFNQIN